MQIFWAPSNKALQLTAPSVMLLLFSLAKACLWPAAERWRYVLKNKKIKSRKLIWPKAIEANAGKIIWVEPDLLLGHGVKAIRQDHKADNARGPNEVIQTKAIKALQAKRAYRSTACG